MAGNCFCECNGSQLTYMINMTIEAMEANMTAPAPKEPAGTVTKYSPGTPLHTLTLLVHKKWRVES